MAAPAEAEAFPSVFKPGATFVHKPLDRSLQQIRLISIVPEAEGPIQCTIKHVDLDADKTPDYRALSYVWGPPSDVQRIRVNDQDFVVRSNLHHFLQAFRARLFKFRGCGPYEDEIQWLWIDQICIDQAVVQERNHQVRMMSDIYKRASYVYVWLGPSDRRTEAVMRALKSSFRLHLTQRCLAKKMASTKQEMSKYQDAAVWNEPDPLSGTELTHFFQNPYWHRLWIVQEVMLARYIRIMCGETLLSWEELQRFCSTGLGHLPTDAAQAVPSQVIWLAEHAMLAETHSYSTLLLTFSLNECQDPRDKVYGFQGLVNPQDRMEIDYGISVVEVFLYVVAAMVRGVSHIPPTQYGKGLEGLDLRRSPREIFLNAATIMSKRAEDIIQLRFVESLVLLTKQMGLKIPRLENVKKEEALVRETRTLWRDLANLYADEFLSLHATDPARVDISAELQSLSALLYNRYNALSATLRLLLTRIVKLHRNAHEASQLLVEVQTNPADLEKSLRDPRSYDATNEWKILPYYDEDVLKGFTSVKRLMLQESIHQEEGEAAS